MGAGAAAGAPTPAAKLTVMQALLAEALPSSFTADRFPVRWAARALACGHRMGEVADQVGMLPRTFTRHFTAAVGLSPKQFARVARLRRLLETIDDPAAADWAEAAAAHGYYDQSHLIHEFRALTGVTPSAYRPRAPEAPAHLPVATSGGTSRLHRPANARPVV